MSRLFYPSLPCFEILLFIRGAVVPLYFVHVLLFSIDLRKIYNLGKLTKNCRKLQVIQERNQKLQESFTELILGRCAGRSLVGG